MLITAAPCCTATAIWLAASSHGMLGDSGTLSARAPGQTPAMPTPLVGAAATDAVAVPWAATAYLSSVVAMWPPANSGCVGSSWASTSAISGLVDVTGGIGSVGSATIERQSYGVDDSGSFGAASGLPSVFGCA